MAVVKKRFALLRREKKKPSFRGGTDGLTGRSRPRVYVVMESVSLLITRLGSWMNDESLEAGPVIKNCFFSPRPLCPWSIVYFCLR